MVHRFNAQPQPARGLTLLESLVSLAVAAVVSAVLLPQLGGLLQLRRLQAASADWARVVHAARHWSFQQNRPVWLETQGAEAACLLLHDGMRGACKGCSNPSCHSGARVLAVTPTLPPGIAASTNSTSLLWNPAERTVTPTATLRLESQDGRAVHHVVNLAGRLRSCSPGGLVAGMSPC